MGLNPFSHRGLNLFSPSYDLCRHERNLIMHQITKEYKNTPLKNDQIPFHDFCSEHRLWFHDFCSEHRLWARYCLVTNRLKQSLVDSN